MASHKDSLGVWYWEDSSSVYIGRSSCYFSISSSLPSCLRDTYAKPPHSSINLLIDVAWVFTAENIGVGGGIRVQNELMSHQMKAEWLKSLQQNYASNFIASQFLWLIVRGIFFMFLIDLIIHFGRIPSQVVTFLQNIHHLGVAKTVAASVDLALSITLCKGENRWAGFAHAWNSGHVFVSREELEQTLGFNAWKNLSAAVSNSQQSEHLS